MATTGDFSVPSSPRKALGTSVRCSERPSPARRRLFFSSDNTAENSDVVSNDDFVRTLLNELAESHKAKWGFDFERGEPLPNSNFSYERVPAEEVPGFYRCYTMAEQRNARPPPSTITTPLRFSSSIGVSMEDAENFDPACRLVQLEEMEESFATNDTTTSSSTSFESACRGTWHLTADKELLPKTGEVGPESSTHILKEETEEDGGMLYSTDGSKPIDEKVAHRQRLLNMGHKTPRRQTGKIADMLPCRKQLQCSVKGAKKNSPSKKSSGGMSPMKKHREALRKRGKTVGERLATGLATQETQMTI